MEYGTVAGNVIGPIYGLVRGYKELKSFTDLARVAQTLETGAEAAKIPVARAEAAALATSGAAAKGAAFNVGTLANVTKIAGAAAIVAAGAYAAWKLPEWMNDAQTKSDEDMHKDGPVEGVIADAANGLNAVDSTWNNAMELSRKKGGDGGMWPSLPSLSDLQYGWDKTKADRQFIASPNARGKWNAPPSSSSQPSAAAVEGLTGAKKISTPSKAPDWIPTGEQQMHSGESVIRIRQRPADRAHSNRHRASHAPVPRYM
jgi:hypothetical protein